MQITEIYYQKNFQIGDFLYEHYGVRIGISGTDDIDNAYEQAEKIVREQHYLKNKDNSFYANAEPTELPITQVQEVKNSYPVAQEDDIIKEIQSYKLGKAAFKAVYSEMVKGNPKLENAYQNKLAELSK